MKTIGITGGIGTGKSVVCRILESMGYPVFYSDIEAKKCMTDDSLLRQGIIDLLGNEAYQDGQLNKPFIADKIFNNTAHKKAIDSLVHPAVYRAFDAWKLKQRATLVFIESALMIETGSYQKMDKTILVTADMETRIHRVVQRDHISREKVMKRIASQLPEAAKIKVASYCIVNDEDKMILPGIIKIIEDLDEKVFCK